METIYFAGGCFWGVQGFIRNLPGVLQTEVGQGNGTNTSLSSEYDGFAEVVKTDFNPDEVTVTRLMEYFFEIIDPYSLNKQGVDEGLKYRTGVYSTNSEHLKEAQAFLDARDDREKIVVEVLPLHNYVKSEEAHQDRMIHCPDGYCHLPLDLMNKYKQ